MVALIAVVCQVLPPLAAYWTVQLLAVMGAEVGLKSSMKSLSQLAPELPPAPYIWLMTRWFTLPIGVKVGVGVIVRVDDGVAVAPPVKVEVDVTVGVAKQLLMKPRPQSKSNTSL